MRDFFRTIARRLEDGEPAVLVTIVAVEGSAPRKSGAMMAVFSEDTLGTIGGGNLEYQAIRRAKELHTDCVERCALTTDAALQMACGGEATLLYHVLTAADISVCRSMTEAPWLLQKCGAIKAAETPEDGWYATQVNIPGTVYLFGGGHISAALAKLLVPLGFSVTIMDDRAEFADPARFPADVKTICGDFGSLLDYVNLSEQDYAAVLTRGHAADTDVLRQLLGKPLRYLGCIGSRKKLALCKEQLLSEGFSEEQWAKLHAPIGLDIGAQTPAEIAVAIAAELISVRAGR